MSFYSTRYSLINEFSKHLYSGINLRLHIHVLFFLFSGAINIHPSLLPQWKGAAPMSHAILSGAKETGVSIVEVSRDRCVQHCD